MPEDHPSSPSTHFSQNSSHLDAWSDSFLGGFPITGPKMIWGSCTLSQYAWGGTQRFRFVKSSPGDMQPVLRTTALHWALHPQLSCFEKEGHLGRISHWMAGNLMQNFPSPERWPSIHGASTLSNANHTCGLLAIHSSLFISAWKKLSGFFPFFF